MYIFSRFPLHKFIFHLSERSLVIMYDESYTSQSFPAAFNPALRPGARALFSQRGDIAPLNRSTMAPGKDRTARPARPQRSHLRHRLWPKVTINRDFIAAANILGSFWHEVHNLTPGAPFPGRPRVLASPVNQPNAVPTANLVLIPLAQSTLHRARAAAARVGFRQYVR